MKRLPRWLKWLLSLLGVLLILIIGSFLLFNESKPTGRTGPEADQLARKMLQAVDKAAWDTVGVIQWTFKGMHDFVWDKKRHWTIVEWDGQKVVLNINTIKGRAWKDGAELQGAAAEEMVRKAWEYWCNDSFWLNAPVKAFDPGTSRSIVDLEGGRQGLMVSYESGGVTPGDSYLWILDENALPTAWKMWVKIIPFGGLEFSWEDWTEIEGGAQIAQFHKSKILELDISNLKAASDLKAFGFEDDPFASIVE
ncbi:MAG: hypothetical protein AAF990_23950 [Bacteroidota bacterium]